MASVRDLKRQAAVRDAEAAADMRRQGKGRRAATAEHSASVGFTVHDTGFRRQGATAGAGGTIEGRSPVAQDAGRTGFVARAPPPAAPNTFASSKPAGVYKPQTLVASSGAKLNFCPGCGTRNTGGSFCTLCGAKL